MAAQRSFTEYVKKRFDNNFWAAADSYLDTNLDSLGIELKRIHRAGETEISDVKVEHVWIEDKPCMEIHFDVAVSIWFETHEGDYHYDDYDENIVWMMVHCRGDLDKNLDDFEILQVSKYNGKSRAKAPMDDALVPVINKNQLDDAAEQFLREHYKKALLEPMWLDPLELAKSMGLTVRYENITKDGTVFGRSFFCDCQADLYNPLTDEMYQEHIPAGTILVDKKTAFLSVLGSVNNTIVHECVHWDKHKKAFALVRLYDNSLSNIGCQVIGGVTGNRRDSVDWMEWQANVLAPRIQMPITMFKKKVEQLISKYRREMKAYDMIDIIEPIIDELVITFGVSRLAAKIRMLDAGYEEAAGAFIYIDNRYVKPHKPSNGCLDRNKTFSISARDAIVESKFNPELVAVLADNEYVFVDSHFVLNTPLYLETDKYGKQTLTHYARNHMEECCLVFDLKIKTSVTKHYHTECFLNRDGIQFSCRSGMLFITLPSGRVLSYVKPRMGENKFGGESVTYEGVGGTKKWERLESYGPKFVENIVQATSRDILMYAMKTLKCCSIVAHVHDEIIIEADPHMSLDAVCEQMARVPEWANGNTDSSMRSIDTTAFLKCRCRRLHLTSADIPTAATRRRRG